eukprot:TRINITY_DN945_c0_g1_i1.p1 TRINITY_DN945_c0_g1~~TRINITY_DN945_c0_g1_i1.p1  ORF type:complete len:179 (+),score=14.67 TRINITY_DN945_c0_g1_i1:851-1387(+)
MFGLDIFREFCGQNDGEHSTIHPGTLRVENEEVSPLRNRALQNEGEQLAIHPETSRVESEEVVARPNRVAQVSHPAIQLAFYQRLMARLTITQPQARRGVASENEVPSPPPNRVAQYFSWLSTTSYINQAIQFACFAGVVLAAVSQFFNDVDNIKGRLAAILPPKEQEIAASGCQLGT